MRLLPKSEVLMAKATAQKQSIDEGKKLAASVDRLREIRADEETSLETFRRETLAVIQKEITEASAKRDALIGEVSALEKAKREALKPLGEEWEQLNKAKTILADEIQSLTDRKLALDVLEIEIKKRNVTIDQAFTRVTALGQTAESTLAETLKDRARVKEELLTAIKEREETERLRSEMEASLVHRERQCLEREEGVRMREIRLKESEAELRKGKKLLKDRQAMLERTINRNKT